MAMQKKPSRTIIFIVVAFFVMIVTGGVLFRIANRKIQTVFAVDQAIGFSYVAPVAWNPNGKSLAWGKALGMEADNGGAVDVAPNVAARRVLKLTSPDYAVAALAWSHDGKFLATGGGPMLRIWNTGTGKLMHSMTERSHGITCLAWRPGDQYIATAGGEGTVSLWNLASARQVAVLEGSYCVDWSPDGRSLVCGRIGKSGFIWEVGGHSKMALGLMDQKAFEWEITSAKWSPDGKSIVSASPGGLIQLWNAKTGRQLSLVGRHTTEQGQSLAPSLAYDIAWSSDGRYAASTDADGNLRIWDVAQRRQVRAIKVWTEADVVALVNKSGIGGGPTLAWNPLSSTIAVALPNGTALLIDSNTGRVSKTLR